MDFMKSKSVFFVDSLSFKNGGDADLRGHRRLENPRREPDLVRRSYFFMYKLYDLRMSIFIVRDHYKAEPSGEV